MEWKIHEISYGKNFTRWKNFIPQKEKFLSRWKNFGKKILYFQNLEKFRKKLKTEKIQKNLEIYNYKEIQKFKFIKVNYI